MTQQLLIKSQTAAWYLVKHDNYLLYSTAFDNPAWAKTDCSLTLGQTDPNAGTDAVKLTATANNATVLQTIDVGTELLNRVFSIYVKRITGTGDISITANGTDYVVKTTSGVWSRIETDALISGSVDVGIKIAVSGDEVDVAFAQLEDGLIASTYVANTGSRYVVTQIVDADYPANTVRGCAFMDGFFFVMSLKGEIYQSALENAASWAALDFIQSQIDPTDGVYLGKVGSYIVALKQRGTEFFYNAANPTGSVLAPVQNAFVQIGCASADSVQAPAGTLVFVGHTHDGFGRGIYMINGTSLQPISTPSVDKILDADDLATVYSWVARAGSHHLYGLTLVTSGVTMVYDFTTQQWSFFTYLSASGVSKTITAVTAAGVVTSTAHGYSDGDIIEITATNSDFDGWHVVTDVTANTYQIQATGTVFAGTGASEKHTEVHFPVVASTRAKGRQYMQDATTGSLYEFDATLYADAVGATAARIRTPKLDSGSAKNKFMGTAEVIGDKISSTVLVRYTDDDFSTYSKFRPVDLSANRSRIRRLGDFNRRAFEVLHLKDANLRLEALEVE